AEGDIEEAAENASESAKSAGKAVGGAGRDVVRTLEDKVYRRITKTNPLYFDTEEFNASLEPLSSMTERLKRTIGDGGDDEDEREYKMTIKPESDDVEEALGNEFDDESEK
ncbi:MAG: DUF5828 family protein, partial [Halobacteria archaeon]|nr:DUF5828 family protein [Halobacteria archaeon]